MAEPSPELDRILDECLERIADGEWTAEDCMAHYPAHRRALIPLLYLAARLRTAPSSIAPSLRFRTWATDRLRTRLALSQRPPVPPLQAAPQPGWLASRHGFPVLPVMIAVLVAVLSLATSGLVYAADRALPGERLYRLDRTVEDLSLVLTPDAEAKLGLRLDMAAERLQEAQRLAALGDHTNLALALHDYAAIISSIVRHPWPTSRIPLGESLALYRSQLELLRASLPPDLQPEIEDAIDASRWEPGGHDGNDWPPIPAEETPSGPAPTPTASATPVVATPPPIPPTVPEPSDSTPPVGTVEAPGGSEDAPGGEHSSQNPGSWGGAPGQTGDNPGQTGSSPPGQVQGTGDAATPDEAPELVLLAPGGSGDAPGSEHSSENPGSWNQAPGQTGSNPPGQTEDDTPRSRGDPPGQEDGGAPGKSEDEHGGGRGHNP